MTQTPLVDSIPAEDWAGVMGERWLKHLDQFEGMIAPVGQVLLDRAAFRSGERVLDVGCGAGGTSLEIARQVDSQGEVVGLDISPRLIERAEQRARAAAIRNVRFLCADAATAHPEGPSYDHLFSRFGVMFFQDAPAAFANLRKMLRDGARVDFSAWAPARENAWVARMMEIAGRYVELPAPVPRAPGPFALDDSEYVTRLLEGAGFRSVRIDTWRGDQLVGGPGATPRTAADFVFEAMSLGRLLEDSEPDVGKEVKAELEALFGHHESRDGIRMPAAAFLVSATA